MKSIVERACNKIIRHTQWYDRYWGGVQKFWYLRRFNLDVVNLGSNSGLYAFNYDGLDIAGMNWAIGPQSLAHDFNVLKNYFSYLRIGAIVIIPLCPFSSLVSKYSKESNLKYYTFLHPATIFYFEEEERIKALTIKQSPIKAMPWYCVKNTIRELGRLILCRKNSRCDYGGHAKQFITMWKKQFGVEDLDASLTRKHKEEQEIRIKDLIDIIEFCQERSLKPVLVIPPVHPLLSKEITPVCRQNYIYSFVERANRNHVPFLDYMDDARFQKDANFSNSFFMSEKGAKMFTKVVLSDLGISIS